MCLTSIMNLLKNYKKMNYPNNEIQKEGIRGLPSKTVLYFRYLMGGNLQVFSIQLSMGASCRVLVRRHWLFRK